MTTTMIPSTSSSSSATSVTENMCSSKKKKTETETWVAVRKAWVALRPGFGAAWVSCSLALLVGLDVVL